jgi:predicted O-methyltransferase YrrM
VHSALLNLPMASPVPPHSWFHHGEQVLALLEQHRPMVTVELGTWKGGSAIAMARVVRQWGGIVHCVDTWTGDVTGGPVSGHPGMILHAAHNAVACGVSASLRFIPSLTVEAAHAWHGPIDFLYVDADHTDASVTADLHAWWPHLRVGGLIAGDDYRSSLYPGLTDAWDRFEVEAGQAFERVPTPDTNPPGMALIYGVKR